MKVSKRVAQYAADNFNEVMHTTLNPEGPGVVRIHLIPPKFEGREIMGSVAIINGQDIVPVNVSWSILLCEFFKNVNRYNGQELTKEDTEAIMEDTCKGIRKIYPLLPKKIIRNDVEKIMTSFSEIAYGRIPKETIDYLNIGDYAEYMNAPHRMDLLVSSMVKNGKWHCNLKCVHCYAAGQPMTEEEELSTEEWKKVIDKCREVGISQVTFTGGEPTMREDLPELIEYAKWFVTRLNTNGVKLTKEYCSDIKKASLDSMQITFYSADEDIHNKLVGAEQYKNTLQGIENAVEAGINLSINTPLCTLNRDYVKTLELLHSKGVIYVTCSGLITTGNACGDESEKLQLTSSEIEEVLEKAVEYCNANGMEISFTSPGWVKKEFFEEYGLNEPNCGACLSNMAITPGGNVVPCQSYLSAGSLGNILTDSWEDIWNAPLSKERRDYSAEMLGKCPLRRQA